MNDIFIIKLNIIIIIIIFFIVILIYDDEKRSVLYMLNVINKKFLSFIFIVLNEI